MKVLVTGGAGLIGGHVARALAANGHSVLATYHTARPQDNPRDRIEFVHVDLADGLDRLGPVDAIVHAAAHTHVTPGSNTADYVSSNLVGTMNLAGYARNVGVGRVIYVSTISLYGDIPSGTLTEDSPLYGPAMYGTTKYASELILTEHSEAFSTVAVRLPGVVGPGYFTPWIGGVLKKAMGDEPIAIYNPQAPFNNIVDLEEITRFVSHVLDVSPTGSAVYNLAASEPIPVRAVVDTIRDVVGSRSVVREEKGDRASFVIDIDKVRREIGFEPAATRVMVERYARSNL